VCLEKGQQKHGRFWPSVPKGKRIAKFVFREVSAVCPNKKKGAKKSSKEVPLSLPQNKVKKGTKRS
jgi:hypothetical protein